MLDESCESGVLNLLYWAALRGKRAAVLLQLPSIGKLERLHSRLKEAMLPLVRSLHLGSRALAGP